MGLDGYLFAQQFDLFKNLILHNLIGVVVKKINGSCGIGVI